MDKYSDQGRQKAVLGSARAILVSLRALTQGKGIPGVQADPRSAFLGAFLEFEIEDPRGTSCPMVTQQDGSDGDKRSVRVISTAVTKYKGSLEKTLFNQRDGIHCSNCTTGLDGFHERR